jgi:thioredoxin-like negative regulator of GroEL
MKVIELKNNSFDKDAIIKLLENNTCFIGVFSTACFHCNNMKPEWNKLKTSLKKMKSNSVLLEIDAGQLDVINYGPLKNSIRGFPAIMIFKNGEIIEDYAGNRTKDEMLKFFKPHLEKATKKTKKTKKNKKTIRNKTKLRKMTRIARSINFLY